MQPDTGSESDSPCSSRDAPAPAAAHGAAASGKTGKQQRQQQQQKVSKVQQATQHADECTLRHAAAAAGANAPADTPHHEGNATAASRNAAAATAGDDEDVGLYALREEVRAGIAAIEDYFSNNPDAADRLLEEFMAQRQQRLAAAAAAKRGAGQGLALPRLYGRRHHHFATVKLVKRRPGPR